MINAFDVAGNSFRQPLDNKGAPFEVGGLWTLVFSNGRNGANTNSLYFTAGVFILYYHPTNAAFS
jgi:hypothetical protein